MSRKEKIERIAYDLASSAEVSRYGVEIGSRTIAEHSENFNKYIKEATTALDKLMDEARLEGFTAGQEDVLTYYHVDAELRREAKKRYNQQLKQQRK